MWLSCLLHTSNEINTRCSYYCLKCQTFHFPHVDVIRHWFYRLPLNFWRRLSLFVFPLKDNGNSAVLPWWKLCWKGWNYINQMLPTSLLDLWNWFGFISGKNVKIGFLISLFWWFLIHQCWYFCGEY